MNTRNKLQGLALAMLLAVGLVACDKQPGPAETAGKMMDQTANDAGQKIGEAADKMGNAIEATGDKVGEKMNEQSEKAAVAVGDTEITAKVKTAIFAEPGLSSLQISVETLNGVVTLTGSVDSQENIDRAKTLASAVAGVTSVDNKLMVKSS